MYQFFRSAPGGVPTQTAFSQDRYYSRLDGDRDNGVIRNAAHASLKMVVWLSCTVTLHLKVVL